MSSQVVDKKANAQAVRVATSRFGAPIQDPTEALFKAHAASCDYCKPKTPCPDVARFMAASATYFAQYTP